MGYLPKAGDIDIEGLDINAETMSALTTIDPQQWQLENDAIGEYLETYGERLPEELRAEQQNVAAALKAATLEKAS